MRESHRAIALPAAARSFVDNKSMRCRELRRFLKIYSPENWKIPTREGNVMLSAVISLGSAAAVLAWSALAALIAIIL